LSTEEAFYIHNFDRLDSTNIKLWQLIENGALSGTVVTAKEQTAGKGRRGRQWQSPSGGLYLSVFLAPNCASTDLGQLTLCSAWGIASALRDRGIPVGIKWPNDLVLRERKLGGILIETRGQKEIVDRAVIGIGINWRNPTPEVGINLEELTNAIATLEDLRSTVLHGLKTGCDRWQQDGIDPIVRDCDTLLVNRGQTVIVDGCGGVIVGVDKRGHLRVQFPDLQPPQPEIALPPGAIRLGYSSRGEGERGR